MANISQIRLSGTTYNIKDSNATNVVEITQANYDLLPSSAKTNGSIYVITDATAFDPSTKVDTSAITSSITSSSTNSQVAGALATYDAISVATSPINSTLTGHTADTTVHVTAADKTAWNGKSDFSGSYNDLSNKPTVDSTLTSGSTNAVEAQAIFSAINGLFSYNSATSALTITTL